MIPTNIRLAFAAAVRRAQSGWKKDLFVDIYPARYWFIRIEAWESICIQEHFTMRGYHGDENQAESDALAMSFDDMLKDYKKQGWEEVETEWVENGDTPYGSSVTLFRKSI